MSKCNGICTEYPKKGLSCDAKTKYTILGKDYCSAHAIKEVMGILNESKAKSYWQRLFDAILNR